MKKYLVPKEISPLVINLFSKLGRNYSTVPALVGFSCNLDGAILEPISERVQAGRTSPLYVGDILYKEITYETVAAWLVANEVNMLSSAKKEMIGGNWYVDPEVKEAECYAIRLTNSMLRLGESNILTVPNDKNLGLTSKGIPFDLVGKCKTWYLDLLFCPRNEVDKLPEEFKYFRKYKDRWLTLGNSFGSVINVSWESHDKNGETITVSSPYDESYEQEFQKDLNAVIEHLRGE